MRKKVLITGASGFIGRFLVEEALAGGHETWAGVRASSKLDHLQDPRIHLIDLPYDDKEKLTRQLTQFVSEHGPWDYVIHNAGLTKTLNRKDFFRVNAGYTRHFIEALAAAGCEPQKFLLMSSLSSYGKGDEQTFAPIRRDDPQLPDSDYGKSKLEAECIVRHQSYFPYVILRPTGVYGPGEKDYFMEMKSIQSGFDFTAGLSPQRISFIYVKDLARAALSAVRNEAILNTHYFVSDGNTYTDTEFARLIRDILGKKHLLRVRIPMGLVFLACLCSEWTGKLSGKSMTLNLDKYFILKGRNWICESTPLWRDLDMTPAYDLRQGLQETIEWYRKEGWL
ncbi:MAG: NAD(P)-dependent oxidoreductase [Tannerellaceae bacterium]|jgi:nucleoside-diphosphate-sugar epimerase|nr:NAD(P)-dependent oxidoreductase [Tannerellaceae bacterium]